MPAITASYHPAATACLQTGTGSVCHRRASLETTNRLLTICQAVVLFSAGLSAVPAGREPDEGRLACPDGQARHGPVCLSRICKKRPSKRPRADSRPVPGTTVQRLPPDLPSGQTATCSRTETGDQLPPVCQSWVLFSTPMSARRSIRYRTRTDGRLPAACKTVVLFAVG
jgi:hypothetical protein